MTLLALQLILEIGKREIVRVFRRRNSFFLKVFLRTHPGERSENFESEHTFFIGNTILKVHS
jgi:hypothetical protein